MKSEAAWVRYRSRSEENLDEGEVSVLAGYKLDRIITNSKSQNSDRLYLYTPKTGEDLAN